MTPELQQPRRRPSWHPSTIWGAFVRGQRPGDPQVRSKAGRISTLGIVGGVVTSLLVMVSDTLKAQSRAMEAIPVVLRDALREDRAAARVELEKLGGQIDGLSDRAELLQAEASTVRGMVLGRLRCPPCAACPACPAPPAKPAEQQSLPRWMRER